MFIRHNRRFTGHPEEVEGGIITIAMFQEISNTLYPVTNSLID
jgi:hypothetical protein